MLYIALKGLFRNVDLPPLEIYWKTHVSLASSSDDAVIMSCCCHHVLLLLSCPAAVVYVVWCGVVWCGVVVSCFTVFLSVCLSVCLMCCFLAALLPADSHAGDRAEGHYQHLLGARVSNQD